MTSPHADPARPTHILVADDDPLIQEVLQIKLEKEGYQVTLAADGETTLHKVMELSPNLLILDIKMPKRDGYEVCSYLRANEKTVTLPILMLTAYGGIDHILQGLAAGADDYVTKPFHVEEVLLRVRSLLRWRQVERELREKETHLARVETLQHLLVTLAHHINNALAILDGRAQILKSTDAAAQKLRETCLHQSRRIGAVLESLKAAAAQMNFTTIPYANSHLQMLDLENDIAKRLQQMEEME